MEEPIKHFQGLERNVSQTQKQAKSNLVITFWVLKYLCNFPDFF